MGNPKEMSIDSNVITEGVTRKQLLTFIAYYSICGDRMNPAEVLP